MAVLFVQTSDPQKYFPYLELTSKTISRYCGLFEGCSSYNYVGLIRGFHPWQACFNRISLISEMLHAGKRGWVFYVDADAFIIDMSFDLQAYLSEKKDFAMVAAKAFPGDCEWWNINDGIFAFNLEHPSAKTILSMWAAKFAAISDGALLEAYDWNIIPGDQALLHSVFQDAPWLQTCLFTENVSDIINSETATFAKQVLRVQGNLASRLDQLRNNVEKVLGENFSAIQTQYMDRYILNEQVITSLYNCLLLRPPDSIGLAAKTARISAGETSWDLEVESFLYSSEFHNILQVFLKKYRN